MNKTLCAIIASLSLGACGPRLNEGQVYSKNYYPPYTSFMPVGKVLVPQHHSERYALGIQGVNPKSGKYETEEWTIPKKFSKDIKLGDCIRRLEESGYAYRVECSELPGFQ